MRKGKRGRRRAPGRRKEPRLYTRESVDGMVGVDEADARWADGMGGETTLPLLRGHVGRKRRLLLEAWATRSSVSQLGQLQLGVWDMDMRRRLTASPHEGRPFAGRVARSWRGFTHPAAPVFARSGRSGTCHPTPVLPTTLQTFPACSWPICVRAAVAVIIVLPLHLPRQ